MLVHPRALTHAHASFLHALESSCMLVRMCILVHPCAHFCILLQPSCTLMHPHAPPYTLARPCILAFFCVSPCKPAHPCVLVHHRTSSCSPVHARASLCTPVHHRAPGCNPPYVPGAPSGAPVHTHDLSLCSALPNLMRRCPRAPLPRRPSKTGPNPRKMGRLRPPTLPPALPPTFAQLGNK